MRKSPWPWVGLLCATATASYLCRVNVSVVGDVLMKEFGLSQARLGGIFSAFLLGYALFQIPGGMLADRLGPRVVLAAAGFWWVVCTFLMSLAGTSLVPVGITASVGLILGVRFLLGVGEAPTFPAAARGVSMWVEPSKHGRANGLVVAAVGLGSAIAPLLITSLMLWWGWRVALLLSAIPAAIVSFVWLRLREPARREAAGAGDAGAGAEEEGGRMCTPSFVLLTASYTLQGYVGYIFVFWFYLYLVQERHFDLLRSAFLSSLPWLLSIVSIPLGGWISDRLVAGRPGLVWGRRIVPAAGMVLAGVFLSVGAHTTSGIVAALSLGLSTAFVLCVEGPFWATMMEIAGRRSGAAGGVMNMGSNIGGLISPTLTPLLAERVGWENALHLAAVLSVVAGILWLGITPRVACGVERSGERE
jgi:MFS transporter, ACS family, glucarate transporter